MNLPEVLKRVSKSVWMAVGLLLLGLVAILDYITGIELSFSLFYLIPIGMVSWVVSEQLGMLTVVLSAGMWLVVELVSGITYASPFVYMWNTIIRIGSFSVLVFTIRLLRTMERERMFARTDFLTGVMNARYFHELAQMEVDRSLRYQHPFTVAFIDVDNFKSINDTFGHTVGDVVLRAIATSIQAHLRKTDIVARVGGDEFVVLLPETDAETAPLVISNMQRALLKEMGENNWAITFSIGVLTLTAPRISVDEILRRVDKLMYVVKNASKNNVYYATESQETIATDLNV